MSLNVTVGTDTYIDRRFGVFTGTIPKVDRGENYSVAVNVTNAGPGEAERLRVSLSNPVPFSSLANYSADRGRWRPEPSAWTGDLPAGTTTVPRTTLAIDAFGVGGRFYQLTASARWSGETIANDTRIVLVGDLDEPVPRARLAVNDSTPKVGQPVRLDASASFYEGGDDSLLEYSWDYDGDPDTDETGSRRVVTSFASRGCYEMSVEVSVGSGFDRATRTVAVGGEDCGSDDDEDTPSAPDNRPPEAEFTFSPATPLVGEAVSFDASGSRDRDGFVTRFEWDLDEDGTVERTGKRLSDVELAADGDPVSDTVNVTLTVTDAEGATDSVTREVDVAGEGETPTARFDFVAQDTVIGDDPGSGDGTERINVDETVVFDAGPSTPGQSEIISYEWTFSDAIPKFRLRKSATGEVVQRSFPFPGTYEARLTVETLGGLTDTISRTVTVFPKDRGPAIVSVEFEKKGRLIKRIGLQQTVNVSIVPETENTTTATVEVTLPGGTTLDATKTADEPFETWTAEFAADDIATDEEPLRVLAVDERGNTDRQRVGLDAVRPPNWWFALFGGVRTPGEVDIGDEIAIDETERQPAFGGDTYVLSSNQPLQRLLGIPPLEFTLVGDGPYSGTWSAKLDFGLYAAEHTLRDAVTTFGLTEKKGGIVVGVALTTPERYPDPDITVSRQGTQTETVSASLAKFTFGGEVSVGSETEAVRLTELEATVLATVTLQSPVAIGWTVQTPFGGVRLGLVPIVELTFGPRVEAIDGSGSTGLVRGLSLGLESVVKPKGRAEAGVNDVNLDVPKVGTAGVNAYGFGEIQGDFVYQSFPESERGLQGQPTYRYRIGAETCITVPTGPGQSEENCLEDTFREGSGPVRVPESLGAKAHPTTRDAAASTDEELGRTPPRALSADAAASGSLVRLTNDTVADRTPAVTAAALPTAVWTAPAPGSESAAGLEVYAATRRNGSWTRQPVTDDERADVGPAVGTAGDRRLAAWSRVRSNASGADDLPTDVVVAPATADGWTTPVAITDGRGLRLGVGVAGVETADGPRWLVAWFEDADANLSVRQAAAAVNGTELLAIATASAGRTPADVFVRTGSVRSDLVVDATAITSGPPTVGAPVTVRYTVRNTGPLTTAPTTVLFRNRTGPIRSARIGPLGPGDRAAGNATFRLDRAGSVTVAVDPTGGIPERNESNNVATAVGARPDLDVVGVVDRRAGDRLELTVVVRNRGPIPVGKLPFRVTAGNESVTATLDGLGAGRTWNRTVTLNASRIPTSAVVEVVLDPDDRVNESDETNNAFTGRVLRADVGVDGGVAVYDDPQGARAELAVRNSDTGAPTANLTLGTSAGSRTYRLELPAARGSEDAAFRVVSLAVPEIGAGGNLTLSADPRGIDADPTDNAARQRIARVESARNASAARLTIGDATGRLVDGTAVIELTLRNPGTLTTGEVVTVSRGGTVRARQPVAVAPGTETVRLRTNASSGGTYTVATATDSATVEVASALPGPPRDPDNDGLFEDVNGDGSANVIDVAVLLERFDRPAYQDAADRFDFTGDGRLNILDVAELLAAV